MNFIYSLLFPLIFWLEIHSYPGVSVLLVILLAWSYWKIIFNNQVEIVLFLILFSRCINGFLMPGNDFAFLIGNILSGYLPMILVLARKLSEANSKPVIGRSRSNWLLIYIAILVFYSLFDIGLSFYELKARLLPMVVLWLYIVFSFESIPLAKLVPMFRVFSVGMLFVYLDPAYLINRLPMVTEPLVFRESIPAVPVSELLRNWGFFWDARILGVFGYSYFLCSVLWSNSGKYWDLLISTCIVLTSLSRGGIFVLALLWIAVYIKWLSQKTRSKILIFVSVCATLLLIVVFANVVLPTELKELIGIASGSVDPITQRSGFMEYALNRFLNNPFGSGLGSLKAPGATVGIEVGGIVYDRATDAYWAILLAEIGVVGVMVFIKVLWEVVYAYNIYIIFFAIGFVVQLIGTDVPDMGLFFFVFMAIWTVNKRYVESKLVSA